MTNALEVKNVTKSYAAKKVLADLSFSVKSGDFFGLLGQNGAGKSTLMDCILGIQKFEKGEIILLGKSVDKISKQDYEQIGVQFQESNYPKKLRVDEICLLTSSYYKNPADWQELLAVFELEEKRKQMIETLSGGERQKLSVLLTLIPNPKIIFLDELTTGLDVIARRKVWQILSKLKDKGITIFLTSHYMDEVEYLCDRIGMLKEGEITLTGTIPEVLMKLGCQTLEEAYVCYTEKEME